MDKMFEIPYNPQSKNWDNTVIHVRMLERKATGEYAPCALSRPSFAASPSDWLSFDVKKQDEIYFADVAITQSFLGVPGDDKFSRVIPVTIEAFTPEQPGTPSQKISMSCQVKVEKPSVAMGYSVKPGEFWKDGTITVPADGKAAFTLMVWVEQVDPKTREVYRAPDEDFQFTYSSTISSEDLACIDAKDEKIKPDSSWKSSRVINGLKEPVTGKITVRAYYASGNDQGKEAGKIDIPASLYSPKMDVKTEFSPPLPAIPGREVSISLTITNQTTGEALANSPITLGWGELSRKGPLGAIPQPHGQTDANGQVTFAYAPPEELKYQRKKRFFDELSISVGEGKNIRVLEDPFFIPVAPLVEFRGESKKKGLKADSAVDHITVNPELITGDKIVGNLILPCEIPPRARKLFGVDKAEIGIKFSAEEKPSITLQTGRNGKYQFQLPEIGEAFHKAKLEVKDILLSCEPEQQMVLLMALDEEPEKFISTYESELGRGVNWDLFTNAFKMQMEIYRYKFCHQLASLPPENYDLAVGGVELLRAALEGTTIFFRRFRCHEEVVKERVTNLFNSVIGVLLTVFKASEKIRNLGGWAFTKGKALIESLVNSRLVKFLAKGAGRIGGWVGSIGDKALNQIMPYLKRIQGGIQSILNSLSFLGQEVVGWVGKKVDSMVAHIEELSVILSKKIQAFNELLAEAGVHWDDLVEWVKSAGKSAGDKVSGWASGFFGALQEVLEAALNMGATLLVELGNAMQWAISSLFGWFCKKGKPYLQPMWDWLMEHSDETREKVEEILGKQMDGKAFQTAGIEHIIDTILGTIISYFLDPEVGTKTKDDLMAGFQMKLDVLGRQPTFVVGFVYNSVSNQTISKDWQSKRHDFTLAIGDLSERYSWWENAAATVDEMAEVLNTIISTVSLGILLLGIVFSGGTALAVASEAWTAVETAFGMLKAGACDLPILGIAVLGMIYIVVKYDMIVTDLGLSFSGKTA